MIHHIHLTNFRKFKNLDIDCQSKVIVITGPNATGKTSILEAIYVTATSKSHRTNDLERLILQNQEFYTIDIDAEKKYHCVFAKEGRTNSINQVVYSKLSDFIGQLPVILFSPLDIELINGAKGIRRRFLDLEISLLDKTYLRQITAYKRLLKERNELLKIYSESKKEILDVLTKQFIEILLILNQKRKSFINEINQNLKVVCKKLQCEQIELKYVSTYDETNPLESFQNKLNYDILTKTTNLGLHRDDFIIIINQLEAISYASEGQKRNAVLAIKFALKQLYYTRNLDVILLLDDVFASMDQKRMNHIMEYIKNENQTFITTTSLFNIPDELMKDAKIVKL